MYHTDDALWKGLLENIFDDFLRFFFKNADEIFEIEKGFIYLDKELADLFPHEEGNSPKHVDKLVRVFTKEGQDNWILIHIEVQGQSDPHFAFRMFTYYYRILDRYGIAVTAIALLADGVKSFYPRMFESEFMGTKIKFNFNSYKILIQDERLLEANNNPFSIAVLTVLVALKNKKSKDEKLFELKYKLLRNLIRRQIPPKKIDSLMTFLQMYLRFENTEYNRKFEQVIDKLNEHRQTMGIKEFVLDRAKKEGLDQKEYEKNLAFTRSLISETEFSDEKIASLVGVSAGYVKNIRATPQT